MCYKESKILYDAGFGRGNEPGTVQFAPWDDNRQLPVIGENGYIDLRNIQWYLLDCFWSVLERESHVRYIRVQIGCPDDLAMLVRCLDRYVPETFDIDMCERSYPNRSVRKFIRAVSNCSELMMEHWDERVILRLLNYERIPPFLAFYECDLSRACEDRIAELVADGTLRGLRLCDTSGLFVRLPSALRDPRCVLETLSLDCDKSVIPEIREAPSLRKISFHAWDSEFDARCARFISRLHGLQSLALCGSVAAKKGLRRAILKHAETLESLKLYDSSIYDATATFTEILQNSNVLDEIGFGWVVYDDRRLTLPVFISALSTSRVRRLRITSQCTIEGLEAGIAKSMVQELHYPANRELSEALSQDWFAVIVALLSVALVPRISIASAIRVLPISDLVPRIAETLGWPVRRG
jgi:hypothetical protein